jgi:hypothetical protein
MAEPSDHPADGSANARRRNRLTYLLLTIGSIALMAAVAVYALRAMQSYTFQKERGFRTLVEVSKQLENVQEALVTSLNTYDVHTASKGTESTFTQSMAIKGLKYQNVGVQSSFYEEQCRPAKTWSREMFFFYPQSTATTFALLTCPKPSIPGGAPDLKSAGIDDQRAGFRGDLSTAIRGIVSQRYFDEVVVSLEGGDILVTSGAEDEDGTGSAGFYAKPTRALNITDTKRLLLKANAEIRLAGLDQEPGKEDKGKNDDSAPTTRTPAEPIVFSETIGDQSYRVFMIPFRPEFAWYVPGRSDATVKSDSAGTAGPADTTHERYSRQRVFYLFGFKKADFQADVSAALGPQGNFVVAIVTLLALFAWPLARLHVKHPNDALTRHEILAAVLAVMLIPAVLASTSVWLWRYQTLTAWADDAAARYAKDLRATLQSELQSDVATLRKARDCYREAAPDATFELPQRCPPASASASNANAVEARDVITAEERARFKLVFATDKTGLMMRRRYTVFRDAYYTTLSLGEREYFKALQQGQSWKIGSDQASFVAQRLFSKTDSARMLQVAIPRVDGPEEFNGIVAGSNRVHALVGAVTPLFLRFAVIDVSTGAVVFHSDDSRSLSENFFVESGNNEDLAATVAAGQSASVSGEYMGKRQRFYYAPLQAVPWGVVVFYPTGMLAELPSQSCLSALTAYGAAFISVLVVLLATLAAIGRTRRHRLARWIWIQYSRSAVAMRIGYVSAALLLLSLCLTFMALDRHKLAIAAGFLCAMLVLAAIISPRPRSLRGGLIIGMTLLAITFSAVPVAWLSISYDDAQLDGFIRDKLKVVAADIGHREQVIADDLARWGSLRDDQPRANDLLLKAIFPPQSLYGGIAGFDSGSNGQWNVNVFEPPPFVSAHLPSFGLWRKEVRRHTAETVAQIRRIRLTEARHAWPITDAAVTSAGRPIRISLDYHGNAVPGASPADHEDHETNIDNDSFLWTVLDLLAVLLALGLTGGVTYLFARRVVRTAHSLTTDVSGPLRYPYVFCSASLERAQILEALADLRQGTICATDVWREKLSAFTELHVSAPKLLVLTHVDLAFIDPLRRTALLDLLETLLARVDVNLILLSATSPLSLLHRPEEYPDLKIGATLSANDHVRWNAVLTALAARTSPVIASASGYAAENDAAYRQIWTLCSLAERHLLHSLAIGNLANPRDKALRILLAKGLVHFDPLLTISRKGLKKFAAATEVRMARGAATDGSRAGGKAVRAILVVIVLLAAIALSWAAGNTLRFLTGILVAALGFVGQFSQAFSMIRGGGGGGGGEKS